MKHRFLFLLLLFTAHFAFSQVHVHLKIQDAPKLHLYDTLFAAGNFSAWVPRDNQYRFTPAKDISDGVQSLDLYLSKGRYEYKITRGSWNSVESTLKGENIPNRELKIAGDTTIILTIAGWKDDFKQTDIQRRHTRSQQVIIMDTAFYMPQLDRSRRIWLYLPKGYNKNKKHYPVVYMQDGQNLFDEFTAGFGEWGVDEYLDSAHNKGLDCILVGVDNGPKRMNEYNPYEFRKFGKPEGEAYIDFLVKTLKPYIDKHFKTLPGKWHTSIAGSSMGGLISMAAVARYPAVFGGAGIFSPAFWTAPEFTTQIKAKASNFNSKLFFYAGVTESEEMLPDMRKIEEILKASSRSKIREITDPEAKHNESAWRKYLPAFFEWILLRSQTR